ncbi:hypothetical protein [Chryseobacterium sp. StRB126]|uniref:hypothetical protein n=1 Tax=Chryseobacterium sp. StRB126 TaxID=878220 RepID=UPI001610AC4E|nr:hypothetical protein [Chryseobacterium sp. StRB126]
MLRNIVSSKPNRLEQWLENALQLLEDKRFHSVSIAVLKDGTSTIKHFGELTIRKGNKP